MLQNKEAIEKLNTSLIATPLRLKYYNTNEFVQVLYCGQAEIQGQPAYLFTDGIVRGLDSTFAVSKRAILNGIGNGQYAFDFENNDPLKVAKLIQFVQGNAKTEDIIKENNIHWHREYYYGGSKPDKTKPDDWVTSYVWKDWRIKLNYHHNKVDSYVVHYKGELLRGVRTLKEAKQFVELQLKN